MALHVCDEQLSQIVVQRLDAVAGLWVVRRVGDCLYIPGELLGVSSSNPTSCCTARSSRSAGSRSLRRVTSTGSMIRRATWAWVSTNSADFEPK